MRRAIPAHRRQSARCAARSPDAYADTQGEPRVTAAIQDDELTIIIRDTGHGLVEKRDSPGLGAGLAIITSLAQALKIVTDARCTHIHMGFACPNAG